MQTPPRTSGTREKGFTLIELLVVIVIVGILAALVVGGAGASKVRGRDAERIAEIRQIQVALELYYDRNSVYPISVTAGQAPTVLSALVSGSYMAFVPDDPQAALGPHYMYQSNAAGTAYCIGANLESTANASDTCTTPDLGATYEYRTGPTGP